MTGTEISLGRETVSGTAAKLVMAVAGFAGTIVFARLLEPSAFGGVYLLIALANVIDRPMLGWAKAGKHRLSSGQYSAAETLGAMLVGSTAWVAIVGLGALVAAPLLADYTGFPVAVAVVLLTLHVATESGSEVIGRLVQGTGKVAFTMWTNAGRAYLLLALQLGLVLLVGAVGMIYGIAAASVATGIVLVVALGVWPTWPSKTVLADHWRYARGSIPTSVLETGYTRLDFLLIGALLATASAGYYKVALALTLPATFLSGALSPALMTAVSGRDDEQGAIEDIQNAVAYSSVLAIPLLAGAAVVAQPLVETAYGAEYAAAAPLLVGLAAYRVLQSQTGPLLNAIHGLESPGVVGRITAIAVVVNLAIGAVLILSVGVLGVVIATVIAEAIRCVGARWWLNRQLSTGSLVVRQHATQTAAAGVMASAVIGCRWLLTPLDTVGVALIVGVGAAIYGAALATISPAIRTTAHELMHDARKQNRLGQVL